MTYIRGENKGSMRADWLILNAMYSDGFVAARVFLVTYIAVLKCYGTAYTKDHGRTQEGIPIGQVLTPEMVYLPDPLYFLIRREPI